MRSNHSPLRYPGGKNCLFPFVSNIITENDLVGCKYVEPYAGGAGLALRLLYEEYVSSIVINDLDPLVNAFWLMCTRFPDRLIAWIEDVPITVDIWKRCKETIKEPDSQDFFELATSFFFLNRTNVSGVLSGGLIGGINQTGKYKINARFNKKALIQKIIQISRFSNRIEVSRMDGVELIKKYSEYFDDTFIYLDPPYYEKGSNLYLNAYNEADHIRLSQYVDELRTPWMLSYDNHKFILGLYEKHQKCAYKLQHSTSNKVGEEALVFSSKVSFKNSLPHLKSAVIL